MGEEDAPAGDAAAKGVGLHAAGDEAVTHDVAIPLPRRETGVALAQIALSVVSAFVAVRFLEDGHARPSRNVADVGDTLFGNRNRTASRIVGQAARPRLRVQI